MHFAVAIGAEEKEIIELVRAAVISFFDMVHVEDGMVRVLAILTARAAQFHELGFDILIFFRLIVGASLKIFNSCARFV